MRAGMEQKEKEFVETGAEISFEGVRLTVNYAN